MEIDKDHNYEEKKKLIGKIYVLIRVMDIDEKIPSIESNLEELRYMHEELSDIFETMVHMRRVEELTKRFDVLL